MRCSEKMASSSARLEREFVTCSSFILEPQKTKDICWETETCLAAAIRQGIHALIITDSFMSELFDAVEDRVSQRIFDPTSDTHTKSFLQNSVIDYFNSQCAWIKIWRLVSQFSFHIRHLQGEPCTDDSNALFISQWHGFMDLMTELHLPVLVGGVGAFGFVVHVVYVYRTMI